MGVETRHGLIPASTLTQEQLGHIEKLISLCVAAEGVEGALHLAPPRPMPGDESNQILYYKEGTLVGIVTLPPDDDIELLGMVLPDHRRQGIGNALLEAAKSECRRRKVSKFLLVCEESSPTAKAFARANGGAYRFSEYRMELDPTAFRSSPPRAEAITLRRADADELETLVRLAGEEGSDSVAKWLRESNQRFYIGWLGREAVGVVRAAFIEAVYLNTFRVAPNFRGRGFGRQILEGVVQELLSEGKSVRLEVETENETAISLYRSCGFKSITTFLYYEMESGLVESRRQDMSGN